MAKDKTTKNPAEEFEHYKPLGPGLKSADGPVPWENWDNDPPVTDKPPGEVYEYLTERDKASKKPKP